MLRRWLLNFGSPLWRSPLWLSAQPLVRLHLPDAFSGVMVVCTISALAHARQGAAVVWTAHTTAGTMRSGWHTNLSHRA